MAKCIMELERIYGIEHGGDRKSSGQNVNLITQEKLENKLNKTIKNYSIPFKHI